MVTRSLKAITRLFGLMALTIYMVVTRTWFLVTAVWTILFFVMGSPRTASHMRQWLAGVMPGSVQVGNIRPTINPFNLDLFDVNLARPNGHRVIHVDHLRVKINPIPLALSLSGARKRVVLVFSRIILDGFDVSLDFDKNNKFVFVNTFTKPKNKKNTKKHHGPGPLLEFENVIAHHGKVSIPLNAVFIRLTNLDFETNLTVEPRAAVFLRIDTRNLTAGKGVTTLKNCNMGKRICNTSIKNLKVTHFHMENTSFSVHGGDIRIRDGEILVDGEMSFPPQGMRFTTKGKITLAGPDFLKELTHGFVSGPVTADISGTGTVHNPSFFANINSSALAIRGINGPGKFHGELVGVKPRDGGFDFIIQNGKLAGSGSWIKVKRFAINPFMPGLIRDTHVVFENISSNFVALAPRFLGLPSRYSGSLWLSPTLDAGKSLKLKLFTRVNRPGLFAPGKLTLSLRAELDNAFRRMKKIRLNIKRPAERFVFRGDVDLASGGLKGRMSMDWDIAGLAKFLHQPVRGTLKGTNLEVGGKVFAPVFKGTVQSTNLKIPGGAPYYLRTSCTVSANGLDCPMLRIMGNRSVFVVKGLALHGWQRFKLDSGKGVLDLGLLHAGLSGRVSLGLTRINFLTREPLKSMRGQITATGGKVVFRDFTLTNLTGRVRADKRGLDVQGLRFGMGNGTVKFQGRLDRRFRNLDGRLSIEGCQLGAMKFCAGLCKGTLQGGLTLNMRKGVIKTDGKLWIKSAGWGDADLDDISLSVSTNKDGFIGLTGMAMKGRLTLSPGSGLQIPRHGGGKFVIKGNLNNVNVGIFAGTAWPEELKSILSAKIDMAWDFSSSTLDGALTIPVGGLKLLFNPAQKQLKNPVKARIHFRNGGFDSQGIVIDDGKREFSVSLSGRQDFRNVRLRINGDVGMYFLRFFKNVILNAAGYVNLAMNVEKGPAGTSMAGKVVTGEARLNVKGVSDTIRVQPGGVIGLIALNGNTIMKVDETHRLQAVVGDGRVAVWGKGEMDGHSLVSAGVHLDGVNLKVESRNMGWMNITPQMDLAVVNGRSMISGTLNITEGVYTKDFSKFMGLNYQARTPGLLEMFPWIGATRLNLRVKGKNFRVKSRLPLGKTDLVLDMDLNIRGTMGAPEVYNRVEVVPGGTVYYNLVTRRFNVARGVLRFDGNMEHPNIDLVAQTKVNYHRKNSTSSVVQSRFIAEALEDTGLRNSSQITVRLVLRGRFPNLSVNLDSNARDLDQVDLEYLLLTGMTRQDIGSGGAGLNMGMLTEGLSGVLAKALMTPVIDVASIGIQPTGGFTADLSLKLGHNLSLSTSMEQSSIFSRYSAGFRFRLSERLSLEGFVRSVEMSPDPSEVGRRYESKLRYRIPLE